jgi:hypothetical protein
MVFTRLTYRSSQNVVTTYERLLNAKGDLGDLWSERHPGTLSEEIETSAGECIDVAPPSDDLSGRAQESVVYVFWTTRADVLDPVLRELGFELVERSPPGGTP